MLVSAGCHLYNW